jgi:hypothetical protein
MKFLTFYRHSSASRTVEKKTYDVKDIFIGLGNFPQSQAMRSAITSISATTTATTRIS